MASAQAFDVIVVGGGLAGSALAGVLAQSGLGVLVVEREAGFRDRIRGELTWPWGVAEAQELGLEAVLQQAGRVELSAVQFYEEQRLAVTEPFESVPMIGFSHPRLQEALFTWAGVQGATTVRPAKATATAGRRSRWSPMVGRWTTPRGWWSGPTASSRRCAAGPGVKPRPIRSIIALVACWSPACRPPGSSSAMPGRHPPNASGSPRVRRRPACTCGCVPSGYGSPASIARLPRLSATLRRLCRRGHWPVHNKLDRSGSFRTAMSGRVRSRETASCSLATPRERPTLPGDWEPRCCSATCANYGTCC